MGTIISIDLSGVDEFKKKLQQSIVNIVNHEVPIGKTVLITVAATMLVELIVFRNFKTTFVITRNK